MMARIVIKDLKESVELDRAAMRRISGGGSLEFRTPTSESVLFKKKPDWFDPFNFPGSPFYPNQQ
jgi:hypothetical protein